MDRLVELKQQRRGRPRCSGARSPRRTCPGAAGSTTRTPRRSRASPPAPTWRRTTRCSPRPSSAAGSPSGIPIDDIAEYLNLTALFRNQWGFRPENGENDTEFKDRVKADAARAAGQGQGGRPARAAGRLRPLRRQRRGQRPRHLEGRERGPRSGCASPSPASARSRGSASPTSSARPARARRTSPASCSCTIGARASEETARLFAENQYQDYLFLHGLGVEMAEALAEYWHRRIREELGFADEDGPTLTGLFRQQYRGGRYSWGYPACPDLDRQRQGRGAAGRGPHRRDGQRGVPAPPRADDRRHHLPPPGGQVLRRVRPSRGPGAAGPGRTVAGALAGCCVLLLAWRAARVLPAGRRPPAPAAASPPPRSARW